MFKRITLFLMVVVLAACSSAGSGPNTPLPTDPNAPTGPTDPSLPVDPNACTYVLTKNITVPSKLINTAASCDYLLEGFVEVSSTLVIEPGVRIVAKQDAILWVDGGQIEAVGRADARIVMEGLNHVSGYWDGIRFAEGRESNFAYFDLKDAGQTCSSLWCPEGALILDDVTVSFTNSSISNSYVHGLNIRSNVLITKFENNRFYNNVYAGVLTDANYVTALDAASDYYGEGAPNGRPYVQLYSGDLEDGKTRNWKKLNAPYYIGGYLNIDGGIVILEPGVELVFDEGAWLTMHGNGELRALGTAEQRVVFRGRKAEAGYWEGITFWDSDWDTNEFNYVEIYHSGNTDGLSNPFAAIRLRYQSTVKVSNSIIADNARYAIACDEQSNVVGSPTLILGEGNSFNRNDSGDIDPDCQAAMKP